MTARRRRVVLVAGPPAAGKTRYVAERKRPGDVVVDFDQLCRWLGSDSDHDHSPEIREKGRRALQAADEWVASRTYGTLWVIRQAPHAAERALLAQGIGATEVHVLAVPRATAKERAAADGRPAWTGRAIDRWWNRYSRSNDPIEQEITE